MNNYEQTTKEVRDAFDSLCKGRVEAAVKAERKKIRASMKKAFRRMAAFIRADERNSWPAEMEAMERQVNILTDALAQAKAEEREACAKICDDIWQEDGTAFDCRESIRARGDK